MHSTHAPIVLIILDGWGYSEDPTDNAIYHASKPFWDKAWSEYPHTLINASGTNVGLPGDQMGNSEVGHMNIGSGRIIKQEYTRITDAIADGSFFSNKVLKPAMEKTAGAGKALHILGLLSPGGVHSHQDHIFALMDLAARCGLKEIYLHAFLDGRDTPPSSAGGYIRTALQRMDQTGRGKFASITGRYYAMDRNKNWDRTRQAYELLTLGQSEYLAEDAATALETAYARGETDEFVKPTAIVDSQMQPVRIADGDLVVFANFRADRARQLTQAFTDRDFDGFTRNSRPRLQSFICMTEYKDDFGIPVAFPPETHRNVLGEYLANHGFKQIRIAETEKYAHVTFFFNGGQETVYANEDRILIPSPDVATYDLKPEMSACEVTETIVKAIHSGHYDVIITNFANADMVGHTGKFDAAVSSIETLDKCLEEIARATRQAGGELLITSDHGNAEQMTAVDPDTGERQPHTAHTSNLVPLIYIGRPAEMATGEGALCDLAPTILTLMGLEPPGEMTGRSLVQPVEHAHPKSSSN